MTMKNILLKATALSLFGAGILAFSGTSYAGCYYGPHRVNARIYRQEGRIYRGVRSGELTRWEARDLRHDERQIYREARYDRFVHGGHLTLADRRDLQHDLNQQSREVYAYKHNGA